MLHAYFCGLAEIKYWQMFLLNNFLGLFYSRYWVIFPFKNSIFFSQSTGKNSQLKVTNWKKKSKLLKSRPTSLLQYLNDGRCHPKLWFFVFIKSLQNCSYVFFPNFQQNATKFPNSMGMCHVPKIMKKIPVYTCIDWYGQVMLRCLSLNPGVVGLSPIMWGQNHDSSYD